MGLSSLNNDKMYSNLKDEGISEAFSSDSESGASNKDDDERINDSNESDDLLSELRDEIGDGFTALLDNKDKDKNASIKRR